MLSKYKLQVLLCNVSIVSDVEGQEKDLWKPERTWLARGPYCIETETETEVRALLSLKSTAPLATGSTKATQPSPIFAPQTPHLLLRIPTFDDVGMIVVDLMFMMSIALNWCHPCHH